MLTHMLAAASLGAASALMMAPAKTLPPASYDMMPPAMMAPAKGSVACPAPMVYKDCGSSCPPTCGDPDDLFCAAVCTPGCFCPDGMILDPFAGTLPQCVADRASCSAGSTSGPVAVVAGPQGAPGAWEKPVTPDTAVGTPGCCKTVQNSNPTVPAGPPQYQESVAKDACTCGGRMGCPLYTHYAGMTCDAAQKADAAIWGPPMAPPPPACNKDLGEVWNACGSACPNNCADTVGEMKPCTMNCVAGCFCPSGLYRDDAAGGRCVAESECTSRGTSMDTSASGTPAMWSGDGGGDVIVPSAPVAMCPAGCKSWYDGCNTCACTAPGQGMCTEMACASPGTAKCMDAPAQGECTADVAKKNTASCPMARCMAPSPCADGTFPALLEEPEVNADGKCCLKMCNFAACPAEANQPTSSVTVTNAMCPAGCKTWFDGCNTCMCTAPGQGGCTKKMCMTKQAPKCMDEPAATTGCCKTVQSMNPTVPAVTQYTEGSSADACACNGMLGCPSFTHFAGMTCDAAKASEGQVNEFMNGDGSGNMGTVGPRWTWDPTFEKPAGTKQMGGADGSSWTAMVYTTEQQQRLGVNENGVQTRLSAAGPVAFGPTAIPDSSSDSDGDSLESSTIAAIVIVCVLVVIAFVAVSGVVVWKLRKAQAASDASSGEFRQLGGQDGYGQNGQYQLQEEDFEAPEKM